VLAVDTNVVVRFLVCDDARQTQRASALFRSEDIWLPKTVLLETEWVLRRLYRLNGDRVLAALRALIGLPNVQVEDAAAVGRALEWTTLGLDFADALHWASRGESRQFVSFDENLVKRSARAGLTGVTLLGV